MSTNVHRVIRKWTADDDDQRIGRAKPTRDEVRAARALAYYILKEIEANYQPSTVLDSVFTITDPDDGDTLAFDLAALTAARTWTVQDVSGTVYVSGGTDVPVTDGGTGLSTVAQGDILYASATNTLASLAKSTSATRYLANTGTSNAPAWAQIDLSNGVTGDLPFANLTQIAGFSLLGKATTGTGDVAGIALSTSRVAGRGTSGNVQGLSAGVGLAFGASSLGVDLTSGEFAQLQNIDSTTISATQWGYLGALDQGVATTSTVQHANLGLGVAVDTDFRAYLSGALGFVEQAAAPTMAATQGAVWVKNDAPSKLQFTNDAGETGSLPQHILVKKASNSTLTDATLASMSMSATIPAGAWYRLELTILCNVNSGDALKVYLAATGTVDVSASLSYTSATSRLVHNSAFTVATSGGVQCVQLVGIVQGLGSGGTLDIQAAKNADAGADGTFYNDSHIVLTRVSA